MWNCATSSSAAFPGWTKDRSERAKPDHCCSSQGPLSSIRAAIKRTRATSQCDHNRERRRPEITILSAEPLPANSWFPGASGIFPPPAPSSPTGWSGGFQAESQPPPSYDQVIKEKTHEEHVARPTAAPRHLACTSTSATQTDPVRDDTQSVERKDTAKKPQKPPRPLLPKSVSRELTIGTSAGADRPTAANAPVSINTGKLSDSKDVKQSDAQDSKCTRSVTVQWDLPRKCPADPLPPSADSQPSSVDASTPLSDSVPTRCPVPLPRLKSSRKPIADEVEVEALVLLGENGEGVSASPGADEAEASSNKYLRELLDVFSADDPSRKDTDTAVQSIPSAKGAADDTEMSALHSDGDFRARIKAFESQASAENGAPPEPSDRPSPRHRNIFNKPLVAGKPAVAAKPSFKQTVENNNTEASTDTAPVPTPSPRPQPPVKPAGLPFKEALPSKVAVLPPSQPSTPAKAKSFPWEEGAAAGPPVPPLKPSQQPLRPNLNLNNHNSTSMVTGNEYVEHPPSLRAPLKHQDGVDCDSGFLNRCSVTRRPTTIRVNRKTNVKSHSFDSPPPLPAQRPVGSLTHAVSHHEAPIPASPSPEFGYKAAESQPPRPIGGKVLPPRPPPAKATPGRPPPPRFDTAGRASSVKVSQWEASFKAQAPTQKKKGPVLPPRPSPGHRLYNKYTLGLPHGIAACDYNGVNRGELSFQKNEVLLLMEETDHSTFTCQVGDARGKVHKSHMKVITPLSSYSEMPQPQSAGPAGSGRDSGLQVQAIYDFVPEGPGELSVRVGDVISMVEQVDDCWYKGTCRGSSGFFPINCVQALTNLPLPSNEPKKPKKPSNIISGPRCVARFDFEGEHADELSFSEGDAIVLIEYVPPDWARGQIGNYTGIFPLNFVEVIEDLPPPTQQQAPNPKIPLPGMVALPNTQPAAAKPVQVSQSAEKWVVALYDFTGQTEEDLSIRQGDCILVTKHVDAEWCTGRLNGKEGFFPTAFVETSSGQLAALDTLHTGGAGGVRAKALFQFHSDCDEELSFQVGDIITNLESVDEEWFLGDLKGKRALVPKNYVQVFG